MTSCLGAELKPLEAFSVVGVPSGWAIASNNSIHSSSQNCGACFSRNPVTPSCNLRPSSAGTCNRFVIILATISSSKPRIRVSLSNTHLFIAVMFTPTMLTFVSSTLENKPSFAILVRSFSSALPNRDVWSTEAPLN